MLERPGLKVDTSQVRGDEKDPFPILGTLYAVRGLVRFGRRDSKSTVLRPKRYTKGPGYPKGYSGQFIAPLSGLPGLPKPLLYAHGSTGTGEGEVPVL